MSVRTGNRTKAARQIFFIASPVEIRPLTIRQSAKLHILRTMKIYKLFLLWQVALAAHFRTILHLSVLVVMDWCQLLPCIDALVGVLPSPVKGTRSRHKHCWECS